MPILALANWLKSLALAWTSTALVPSLGETANTVPLLESTRGPSLILNASPTNNWWTPPGPRGEIVLTDHNTPRLSPTKTLLVTRSSTAGLSLRFTVIGTGQGAPARVGVPLKTPVIL